MKVSRIQEVLYKVIEKPDDYHFKFAIGYQTEFEDIYSIDTV